MLLLFECEFELLFEFEFDDDDVVVVVDTFFSSNRCKLKF